MVLAFALIVVINNVEQPDVSYWASIYKCNSYAKAIEHGQVSSKDSYSNLNRSQVKKPKIVFLHFRHPLK